MSGKINHAAALDFLHSPESAGIKYGMARIQRLVDALGHPERTFSAIHVAGTNGKGSTCAMLEAIYRANGYKTGLYTSPHLVHEGELVQVNRHALTESQIVDYSKRLQPLVAAMYSKNHNDRPSFFEQMTAIGFLHFAETSVDLAIIETGVGGRLDATNVVDPELSIITSISLDHTDLLGDTIEQIATEKAGIIKPGKPVLIGTLCKKAESVIRRVAEENKCTLYSVRERFPDIDALPKTNLAGSFQRWNAAVAVHAIEILNNKFPICSEKIGPALQTINWLGRWQTIQLTDKTLILDATHNAEGATVLAENLKKLVQQTRRKPVIIAGATGELRARSLMSTISQYAEELHLVAPKQPRATSTKTLETYLPTNHQIPVFHQSIEALFPTTHTCTAGEPGGTVVVTGSIYLVGEVLQRLAWQYSNHTN